MIADAILSMLQTLFLWAMGLLDIFIGGPPGWIETAIGSVQTIIGYTWAFNYWVPLEWFVPVAMFVVGVKFPIFVGRVFITIYNIVWHAGA